MSRLLQYRRVAIAGSLLLFATAAAAAPHTYTVVINQLKFGPVPRQLNRGDAIIWYNRDILRHSATAADHSFDADLPPGSEVKTILSKSGAIAFFCRYHPGMRGMLKVK